MNDPGPDLATATRLIRARRSLKPALMDPDRPVPRRLVENLLENALRAPTHGLTEPWFFHVFASPAARARLAAELQALYRDRTPEDAFRPEKFQKLGTVPKIAPVVVVLGMVRQASGKIPEIEEVEAVACAVQNLHLSAEAAGLGGFWSSPPVLYQPEAVARLGLAPADRCLGLFYLGWPGSEARETPPPPTPRRPLAEKSAWHEA